MNIYKLKSSYPFWELELPWISRLRISGKSKSYSIAQFKISVSFVNVYIEVMRVRAVLFLSLVTLHLHKNLRLDLLFKFRLYGRNCKNIMRKKIYTFLVFMIKAINKKNPKYVILYILPFLSSDKVHIQVYIHILVYVL